MNEFYKIQNYGCFRYQEPYKKYLCVSEYFFAFDVAVFGHNPSIPLYLRIDEFGKA